MAKQDLGQVHVYTGEGKGKTTAAIGQAIRCLGAGLNVVMVNFLKNSDSSEFKCLDKLAPNFKYIIANREPRGFYWRLSPEQKTASREDYREAWTKVQQIITQGQCDLLILDEIIPVVEYEIIPLDSLLSTMQACQDRNIELILTGRNAPETIIQKADLVTEMKLIKHPLTKGIKARHGIEH